MNLLSRWCELTDVKVDEKVMLGMEMTGAWCTDQAHPRGRNCNVRGKKEGRRKKHSTLKTVRSIKDTNSHTGSQKWLWLPKRSNNTEFNDWLYLPKINCISFNQSKPVNNQ